MARDIQHRPGVIERIPEPEELDQKQLGILVLKLAQEIKEEIDAIWKMLGKHERAAEPWEAMQAIEEHEVEKERLRILLKNHGK